MEPPVLSDLLDLQEVDLEIDRLLDRRRSLPELERYRQLHERRLEAAAELERLESELRRLGLDLDKAEGELEIIETRFNEAETRLYAGGMSAKETEHKRLEVRSLKGQMEALEERVLGLLDEKERLESEVAAAKGVVDELSEQETALEQTIAAEWKKIDAQVARKEQRKAEIVSGIPPELLTLYERLRRTKEGVAVGRLEDGQCGGCHLHLSAAEQLEAAETDPPRCVHCRRILVM